MEWLPHFSFWILAFHRIAIDSSEMEIDNIAAQLNAAGVDFDFNHLVLAIGAVISGALHITAMDAFTNVWANTPTCCGDVDHRAVNQAADLGNTGIAFAVLSTIVGTIVSIASIFKNKIKKESLQNMNIFKDLLGNTYGVVSIFVMCSEMFVIGQISNDAVTEVLLGSIVALGMLIFKSFKKRAVDETGGCTAGCCIGLSLLLILAQIISSACYLTLNVNISDYCWTYGSGLGPDDDEADGYLTCNSNKCLELDPTVTSMYTNKYGTVTEYCNDSCCYWQTT